jgi:hypothetical protein
VPHKRSPEKRRNLHAGDSILAQVESREMREGPGHPAGHGGRPAPINVRKSAQDRETLVQRYIKVFNPVS